LNIFLDITIKVEVAIFERKVKMTILDGQAFFAAIVFVVAVVAILLIIMVLRSRRGVINDSSTPTNQPCTTAPLTPQNLTASNPQGDLIVFDWDGVSGASEYIAYISIIPGFVIAPETNQRSTIYSSTSFANLSLGTSYYLKVKAINACGESPLSSEITFRLPYVYPARFQIKYQQNNAFTVCDKHNQLFGTTNTLGISRHCSSATSEMTYDTSDNTIRQFIRPGRCLTRLVDNSLSMDVCNGGVDQKWDYNVPDSHLCSFVDGANGCLKPSGAIGEIPVIHGSKGIIDITNQWDIRAV
jgi:hypothetical protein